MKTALAAVTLLLAVLVVGYLDQPPTCDYTITEDNKVTNAMVDRGELPEASREDQPQCKGAN